MDEWAYVPLSELTAPPATYGVVQPGQSTVSGIPMLRVNNFQGHSLDLSEVMRIAPDIEARYERTRLQAGDVLLTIVGSVGQVAIVPDELSGWNIARAVAMIRPNEPELSRWISLVLRSPQAQYQLGVVANTTVQTTINLKDLRELRIPLPGKSERSAIAHILGTLDDKIELNRRMNATLEAMTRALFLSWFVDFDPVRAKLDGRQPIGMDETTALLFPADLVDSELGPIPAGWDVRSVGNAVDCVGGGTPDTKNSAFWQPAEHAWSTPKDLSNLQSPVLLRTERKLSSEGLAKVSSGLLPEGTLLLSSRAPIGYLAIAQIPVAVNQGYIAMTPGGVLPPLFMLFWCQQNMEVIKSHANGSTFMEISKSAFRPLPALIPSPKVLSAFQKLVEPLFFQMVENQKQSSTLAALRNTLLPKLLSGELRIPDVEKQVEDTL